MKWEFYLKFEPLFVSKVLSKDQHSLGYLSHIAYKNLSLEGITLG